MKPAGLAGAVLLAVFIIMPESAWTDDISRGKSLLKAGKLAAARRIFRNIYRGSVSGALKAQARFLFIQTLTSMTARKKHYQLFIKTFKRSPLVYHAYYRIACLFLVEGSYINAERFFILASASHEKSIAAKALIKLGQLALKKKQAQTALKIFTKFIRLFPKSALFTQALLGKGHVYRALKRNKLASRQYLKVLEKSPGGSAAAQALYYLGNLSLRNREFNMARDFYRKLKSRFPNSLEAYLAVRRLRLINLRLPGAKKIRIYEIQLAAFRRSKRALKYVRRLKRKGLRPFIHRYKVGRSMLVSVRIGYYRTRSEALKMLRRLKRRRIRGFIRSRYVKLKERNHGR